MTIQKDSRGNIISGTADRDKGRKTYDYYIGIDPDIDKNGYAVYSKKSKKLVACWALNFYELDDNLRAKKTQEIYCYIIHIEGSWLNSKSNYHGKPKATYSHKEKVIGERIAACVALNQDTGKKIIEMCIHLDISFVVRKPIKPIFADEKVFKKITGWTGRTNKDSRSAALYCFGF